MDFTKALITAEALGQAAISDTRISRAVLANFNAERSGDIYVVFAPHWLVGDFDGLSVASAHGSPWSYDTYVPLMFSGPGMAAQRLTRRVETVDVAPTIVAYLGAKPPSARFAWCCPKPYRTENEDREP